MTYEFNLELPKFFKDENSIEELLVEKRKLTVRPYLFVSKNFKHLINNELLEILKSLGLNPFILILFGHENDIHKKMKQIVHSDLFLENNSWKHFPCALNFEITDTTPSITWYDVNNNIEYYPPLYKEVTDLRYLYANGVHYGPIGQDYKDVETHVRETYKVLHKSEFTSKPKLIRTNVPHCVFYENYVSRHNISIRFPLDQLDSWSKASELFKKFIT